MPSPVITEEQLLANPHDRDLPPSRLPRKVQRAGVALFLLGVLGAAGFVFTEHWRRATFTLGASLFYLALLRLTCDSQVMGVLAVRSRRFDAVYSAILGGLMAFLAASVDALGS